MIIYLCGAIMGKTYMEAVGWRKEAEARLCEYHEVLSPLRVEGYLSSESEVLKDAYHISEEGLKSASTPHAIYTRDMTDIIRCDVVLANLLDESRISIGSIMEIAWASFLRKHVIVVMRKEGIYEHCFVRQAATVVFEDLNEAIKFVKLTL